MMVATHLRALSSGSGMTESALYWRSSIPPPTASPTPGRTPARDSDVPPVTRPGAARVDLVERSRGAAQVAAGNARGAGFESLTRVHATDVRSYLTTRSGQVPLGGDVDLAFLDPPYEVGEEELTGVLDLLAPWMTPDALVVVERSTRSPEPDWPEHLNLEERRAWGETAVWFAGPPLPADEGPLPTGGRPGPGH